MSWLKGVDVSQWNNYAPSSEDFVILKIGGGDAGMYFDSKATLNYNRAKGAGKVVGGYWFAGGGDPVAEADYFCRGMAPYAEDDLFALDWEIQHVNPVDWCTKFVNRVHEKSGVWPFIYINISTCNAYDWSPVLNNCGLWLAAPSFGPNDNAPVPHPYVLQQGPIIGGIDSDYGFLTVEELKKYGYHAASTPPAPVPQPTPPPAPTPPPVVEPSPPPVVPDGRPQEPPSNPTPPEVPPAPVTVVTTPAQSWIERFIIWLKAVFGVH